MIDDIALHREELRELCRRFHVQRLDLVGSATRDDFDPKESLETFSDGQSTLWKRVPWSIPT